ncbi:MAG: hypothetical protein KA399_03310, partial [Chitinophagaceae bacterium]|nr:hypothetical protein [Chitinophagaceae bacterium]
MSLDIAEIKKYLPVFTEELMSEIANYGLIKEIPEGVEILKEGQYIKAIPIVLEGLVKVFTRMEEKELLLYYIGPAQSCIMSFSAGMSNAPSRIFAFTEDASII